MPLRRGIAVLLMTVLVALGGPTLVASASVATSTSSDERLGAPRNVRATADDRSVVVSWTRPRATRGEPIRTYVVSYRAQRGDTWGAWHSLIRPGTTRSATVSPLRNGTRYQLRVAATDAHGRGAYSTWVYARPATVPSSPTTFSIVRTDDQVGLAWNRPRSNGSRITGYVVTYTVGDEPGTVRKVVTQPRLGVRNAPPNVVYRFWVHATSDVGPGPRVGPITAEPLVIPVASTSAQR